MEHALTPDLLQARTSQMHTKVHSVSDACSRSPTCRSSMWHQPPGHWGQVVLMASPLCSKGEAQGPNGIELTFFYQSQNGRKIMYSQHPLMQVYLPVTQRP